MLSTQAAVGMNSSIQFPISSIGPQQLTSELIQHWICPFVAWRPEFPKVISDRHL